MPQIRSKARVHRGVTVAARVLVVDDDPDAREMLSQLLTSEGFVTETACNGQEALDRARVSPPSLIVLDMMMPVMDGWMFCAHRRYDPALAAIPVVILSAAPVNRLQNVGASAVLQKPFEFDDLLSVIRSNC